MNRTLADFKRDVKNKSIQLALIKRENESIEPEWRNVVSSQTNGCYLTYSTEQINKPYFNEIRGKGSWLPFSKATLMEYTSDSLKIYRAGFRALTEDEQKAMDEWKKITDTKEYQDQHTVDLLTDGSLTFYQKKSFFQDRNMLYLMGLETERGMKYDFNTGLVRDEKVRGDLVLEYMVRRV